MLLFYIFTKKPTWQKGQIVDPQMKSGGQAEKIKKKKISKSKIFFNSLAPDLIAKFFTDFLNKNIFSGSVFGGGGGRGV